MRKEARTIDVVTLHTGIVLDMDQLERIMDIAKFMTEDSTITNAQIGRVAEELRPSLLNQFPWLQSIKVPGTMLEEWFKNLIKTRGEFLVVDKAPAGVHAQISPREELISMGYGEKIGHWKKIN